MVNKCIFIGRLGKDPELTYMPQGDPVCKFSLALDESYKNKAGEKVNKTEWVNIVAFRKLADICGQYLSKGSLIFIEGKIQTRTWEKDGEKKYTTEIIANTMKMLGGKKESAKEEGSKWDAPEPGTYDDGDDIPF